LKKLTYLRTITSLRGISILGVLFYHSHYPSFQHGYLGVDVFFVISGFLIGNIIFYELNNSQFKFINFYIRRLRRLLPSLIFTIILAFIISYFTFLPEDFEIFNNSIPYTLLFVGNIFFWNTNDYFSPSTEIMPLSHLWSLALEEQFYLIFPFLIFIIFKYKFFRKNLKLIILIGIFLSFVYTISEFYNLPFDCPATNCIEITNFYWLHTRAWELLIGVLLNFIRVDNFIFNKSALYIGLLIVSFSFIHIPDGLSHPGIGTLPTLFGTVLIILSSLNNDNNFLSNSSLMYFLGKVSYSLYLIHFPIFVIRNYFELNFNIYKNFDLLPILLIFISLFISYFMWKYIEIPFRNYKFLTNKNFLITTVSSILIILIITVFPIIHSKPLNSDYEKFNFSTDFSTKRQCFFEYVPDDLLQIDQCMKPVKNKKNVLVMGSSIGANIFNGLYKLDQESINFDVVTVTGCPPLIDSYEFDILNFSKNKCEVIYKQINKNLIEKNYSKIIFVYQWGELLSNQISKDMSLFDYTINNILVKVPKEKVLIIGPPVNWNVPLNIFAIRELNFRNKVHQYNSSNFDKNIFTIDKLFNNKLIKLQIETYSLIDFFCSESECLTYEKVNDIYYFVSNDHVHITDYFTYKIGQDLFSKLDNIKQE
jgi:peptidoglycan/LPS O-acetylase OafA/YrhL